MAMAAVCPAEAPVFVQTPGPVLALPASPFLAIRASDDAPTHANFEITAEPGIAANQAAMDALARATARWSAVLGNPVTIRMHVDSAALGPLILGQASSTILYGGYDEVRDMLAGAAEPSKPHEVALLPRLPNWSQLSVRLPSGFALDGNACLTLADYHAMGYAGFEEYYDVDITFSDAFPFDYDPRNGVDWNKIDFEGVALHEIGHALGFDSQVDYVDHVASQGQTAGDVWVSAMDMFRFRTADVSAGMDFTNTPRMLSPGGAQSLFYGDGWAALSTGAYTGDGNQASHWEDDLGIGVMDPTFAYGETGRITATDLAALDVLGWNVTPEPATLGLLGIGAIGLLGRRRSQPAYG
jgi:hypothetical protein